jgi:hypothetical protein
MITLDSPDIFGTTIFCDDIRHEVGGKTTYVGVYKGFIGFHGDFPFVLPKFSFGVSFRQRRPLAVSPIKIRIYLPGDEDDAPSIEAELSMDKQQNEPPPFDPGPNSYVSAETNLTFAPFQIMQPGLIKVRAVRSDEMHRLGTITVVQLPSADRAQTLGASAT